MAEDLTGLGKALEPFTKELSKQIESLLGPAMKELGQIFSDQVRYLRLKRAAILCEKAKVLLLSHNIEPGTVPLKILLPIFEGASLEEEESDLTAKWVGILASASAGNRVHSSYPKLLLELSPIEARILDSLYKGDPGLELIGQLRRETLQREAVEASQVDISIENLLRLGLVRLLSADNEELGIVRNISLTPYRIRLTPLAVDFVNACNGPQTETIDQSTTLVSNPTAEGAGLYERQFADAERKNLVVGQLASTLSAFPKERRDNLTPEQLRFLSHLYFEPYQTPDKLADHTGFSVEDVKRIARELSPLVAENGITLFAYVIDRNWSRELAIKATQERSS